MAKTRTQMTEEGKNYQEHLLAVTAIQVAISAGKEMIPQAEQKRILLKKVPIIFDQVFFSVAFGNSLSSITCCKIFFGKAPFWTMGWPFTGMNNKVGIL
jgi:hypothetical protein